jgi:hypothetical protein
MHVKNAVSMNTGVLASGVLLALFTLVPLAQATPVGPHFSFTGQNANGNVHLTLSPDPNGPGCTLSHSNSHCDPVGAQAITGASGMVSDNAAGITNAMITGVQPLNWVDPPTASIPPSTTPLYQENLLASYSGVPPFSSGVGVASYDNLFYAGDSPLVCLVDDNGNLIPTYPFSGGYFDIFGAMFTLDNGDLLGLWSDGSLSGHVSPGAADYGFSLLTKIDGGYKVADSQFNGVVTSVPAPPFVWALGAGLLGLFVWRRAAEKKRLQAGDAVDV